jgi:carbonic anhydrase
VDAQATRRLGRDAIVKLLSAAVEANVRRTVRDVLESPEGRAGTAESEMKLVGAVYDLATGRVRFLD